MGVLVAVPVLVFAIATGIGHLPLNGDNPVQAFPLRELAGQILARGHLPLWDPYVWSGTPLLAGFNAGALYPSTALFAFLPPVVAWATAEALAYVVCGLGFYAFLRAYHRSVGAALLASLSFICAGFMSSQIGHIDLIEGAAYAPWMLLALYRLAGAVGARPGAGAGEAGRDGGWHEAGRDGGWRWALLLGACFTLVILTGDPEAMLDLGILAGVYALSLAVQHPGRGRGILGRALVAAGGALLVGAVQWVPGIVYSAASQRASTTYAFFSSGSLPPQLTLFLVLPWLLGGYLVHGQPDYFGPYNLAELNPYIGILPVMAAFGLMGRRWWRRPSSRGWWVWYLLIAIGLLLAFGSYTPLGPVLHDVPLYGQQRTQSRNLVDVDVALAVLFACWLDQLRSAPGVASIDAPVGPARSGGGPVRGRHRRRRHREGIGGWASGGALVLALVPVGVVVAVWVALRGGHGKVLSTLTGVSVPAGLEAPLHGYVTQAGALAVVAAAVVLAVRRWPRPWRLPALGAVVVADLLLFGAAQYTFATIPASATNATSPLAAKVAVATGPHGRFGVYDPTGEDPRQLYELGVPDLNVLHRLPSVGGYGSLLEARYADATGAHHYGALSAAALGGDTFDQLDLRILVAPPSAFAQAAPGSGAPPVVSPRSVGTGSTASWLLGSSMKVSQVVLPTAAPATVANDPQGLRMGLVDGAGRVTWSQGGLAPGGAGAASASFAPPVSAVAVVIANDGAQAQVLPAPAVQADGARWLLHGDLSDAVAPPHWSWAGSSGPFGLFRDERAQPMFWVTGTGGRPAPAAHLRLLRDTIWGAQTVRVSTPAPATVVRSVSGAPGWSATVTWLGLGGSRPVPAPGPQPVPVRAHGLVQAVTVPAGTSTITWTYRPTSVVVGEVLSLLGLGGVAVLAMGLVVQRQRRLVLVARRRRPAAGPLTEGLPAGG